MTDFEEVSHEKWLIACAAWNNVTPEQMREMCEKDDRRMPEGSRAAWERVFTAVENEVKK